MSASGFLLGLINIGIIAVVLVLVGLLIEWIIGMFAPLPAEIRKFYLVFVLLVVLYHLVALFMGSMPMWRVI